MSDTENTPSKPVTMSRRDVLRNGLLLAGGIVATQASDAFGATRFGIGDRRDMADGIKEMLGLGGRGSRDEYYESASDGEAPMRVLRYEEGSKKVEVYEGVDGPIDQITVTDTSRSHPRGGPYVYTVHIDTQRNEATTRVPVISNLGSLGTLETKHTSIAGTRGLPRLRSATVLDERGYGQTIAANTPPVRQAEKDLATALDLGAKAKGAANTMQQRVVDAPTTRVEKLSDGGVKLVRTFSHRNLPGGKVTHEIPMSPGKHDTTGLTLELLGNLTQVPDYKKMNPQRLEAFSKAAVNTMLWEAQKIVAPPPRNDALLGSTVNLDRVKISAPDLQGRSAKDLDREVPQALEGALNGLKGGATHNSKAKETWSAPGQSAPSRPDGASHRQWQDLRR